MLNRLEPAASDGQRRTLQTLAVSVTANRDVIGISIGDPSQPMGHLHAHSSSVLGWGSRPGAGEG